MARVHTYWWRWVGNLAHDWAWSQRAHIVSEKTAKEELQGKPGAFLVCIKGLGGSVIFAIGWNWAFLQRRQKRTDNGIRYKVTSYDDKDQQYELLNFQRNAQLAPPDRCDVRVELIPVDEGPFAEVGLDGGLSIPW